jgi:hypothetical protein
MSEKKKFGIRVAAVAMLIPMASIRANDSLPQQLATTSTPTIQPTAGSSKGDAPVTAPTWLDQHNGEPGFGTVTSFMISLAELQYHSIGESDHSAAWGGGDTALGLKVLYELDPRKAVWVSKFWRLKARIAEATYLDQLTTEYSKKIDPDKHTSEFETDIDDAFRGYYFDHWKEIEDMIVFNLKTAAAEQSAKK